MISIETENPVQGLTLEEVDADGAIREAIDGVKGDTRAAFLAKAGLLGGGAFGGSALLALMADDAHAAHTGDRAILNFALTLEYLEAAFYTEAQEMGALDGELALFARVVGQHERAHVKALRAALGRHAVKRPRFNFRGTTEDVDAFVATATVLEDTGVSAYQGQAPLIRDNKVLAAALAIHSVEARHAAWIRDINGEEPAPDAFDPALTKRQVLRAVASTRFIVAPRRTRARRSPSFTG
jgi:ferritin-like protein